MSRVAKTPVAIPAGVDVSIKDDQINVKGTGGTLSQAQNVLVKISNNEGKLSFEPVNDSREANAMSGTMRQLVNNMVVGVSKGFEKKLSLVGVGFKASASGSKLKPGDRLFAPGELRNAGRHHCHHPHTDRNLGQGC